MIIVDGKMPRQCAECSFFDVYGGNECSLLCENVFEAYELGNRDPSCHILAEIPDDHGDLIDKQSLLRDIEAINSGDEHTILRAKWMVRTAPTVLGRSKE